MRVAPGHICVAEKNEKNESRTRNQKKKKIRVRLMKQAEKVKRFKIAVGLVPRLFL